MVRTDDVLRLLLVESSLTEADEIITQLRQSGYAVRATRCDTVEGIEQSLTTNSWDLVLCRGDLELVTAEEVLSLIRNVGRDIPCIILVEDPEQLENLYDLGAQDLVLTSDKKRLPFSVNRELDNLFIRRLSRRNERALRESEKRALLLLQTSRDAVAYVHEGMYINVNHSYLTLFDYEEEEDVAGLSILDMVISTDHAKFKTAYRQFSENSGVDSQAVSVVCKKADDEEFSATVEFSKAVVEGEDCTQLVVREALVISETLTLVEPEATPVSAFREIDTLTNLFNRVRFMEELNKAIAQADEEHQVSELLYINIDDFQIIKEKIGLSASDDVLRGVAELLKEKRSEDELLARYSDQVFTVLITSGDDKYVDERSEVFRKTIEDYISTVNGEVFNLKCSIGVSRITENLASPSVGLDRADKACTQAQRAGGNRIVRYQPSAADNSNAGSDASDEGVYWQEQVQEALQKGNFSLYFQPIVGLHGIEQQIYDVMIRMKGAENKLIEASTFISYIQNTELMIGIDEWVLSQALVQLVEHRKEYPKTRFFLKLSKQTLSKPNVIEWVNSTLSEHSLDGSPLVLEISETVALDNLEQTKKVITQLKEFGCEFCLEHFGSGLDFSHSLNVLDVDYLKINGAFVENMAKDAENQAAVKSIIDISKQAGKMTIAEFVSDANSLALLWRLGVDYASGYYIQEPSANLDYNFDEDNM
ncbi:GGDEF domain-containing response regulator [Pseudomonadota bacterium]|nr:GGDEF domain-containing response regulator [Pseudomonadota bacterium]